MMPQEVDPLPSVGDCRQLAETELDRVGILLGQTEERETIQRKAEERMQLVAAAEIVGNRAQADIDLPEQDRIALANGGEVPELAQKCMVRLHVGFETRSSQIDQEWGRVDPESADTLLQPEPDDRVELFAHIRVGEVEIGLEPVEVMEAPGIGRLVI